MLEGFCHFLNLSFEIGDYAGYAFPRRYPNEPVPVPSVPRSMSVSFGSVKSAHPICFGLRLKIQCEEFLSSSFEVGI